MSDAARARRAVREGADCRVGGSLGLEWLHYESVSKLSGIDLALRPKGVVYGISCNVYRTRKKIPL